MQYGYFDNNNKEYVITKPDTPTPWINYIANNEYTGVISNTGGGYSFCKDARYQRILRYRFNNLPVDRPGRYIYIKDKDKYWSVTWQPVIIPPHLINYKCRHGLGYTIIENEYNSILSKVCYFVPQDDNLEIWDLTLENKSKETKNLTIFTYAEFCIYIVLEDLTNFQSTLFRAKINYEDGIIFHSTHNTPCLYKSKEDIFFKYYYSYFTSNIVPIGFDCNREVFIGQYHDESNPIAIEQGKNFNSCFGGGNPIASLSYEVTLLPGEKKRIIHLLGADEKKANCLPVIEKYRKEQEVDKSFLKIKNEWEKNLSNFNVETPDKSFDTGFNIWNQYQCYITFRYSRSLSYLETGHTRGIGFRDSNQDILGFMHNMHLKKDIKKRLISFLENQFSKGYVYHQFFPLTTEGLGPGLWSDDLLWLVLSVCSYLKETGDIDFLNKEIPFADKSSATVYEHLKRSVEYVQTQLGNHKIPLIKAADWNDCINLPEGSESIFTAQLYIYCCNELVELAKEIGNNKDAKKFSLFSQNMKETLNKKCWDGKWYIRALYKNGKPLGSKKCNEGKIFLNPQSWTIIANMASQNRALTCMDSARKYLNTDHGLKLLTPAYNNDYVGETSAYPTGLKENAAIFCQPNQWAIMAECLLGRGNYAYEYHTKLYLETRNRIAEIHQAEPYIYSQFLTGPEHPHFGKAGHPWMTATGSWTFVAISQYIIGIRPTYKGLLIDPCIPHNWEEFKVKRIFRGRTYNITVKNPEKICKGVKKIVIDGKEHENNILPASGKSIQNVVVYMGK